MATNISIPTYGFVNHILALNEGNWRTFFKPFITDSVQSGLATIAGANMTVYVSAGECRCGAVMGILDEMIALDIANGDSTYDRIDSVIVQYTYGEPSTLAVAIIQGTPSANPVPPTLTKVYDTLWQMEIAQILVPSGATSSSEFTITDKRVIYESIESIIDDDIESEERVWSSQKTHEEIVSLSSEIYDRLNTKADAIERTTSGSIVSFTDGADNIPVKELVAGIEPVQNLHGYDSPWPAGARMGAPEESAAYNTASTTLYAVDPDNAVTQTATGWSYTNSQNRGISIYIGYFTAGTVFTIKATSNCNLYRILRASTKVTDTNVSATTEINVGNNDSVWTFTASTTAYYYAAFYQPDKTNQPWAIDNFQVGLGTYSNICPITGHTSATVMRTGKNLFDKTNTALQIEKGYINSNVIATSSGRYLVYIPCKQNTTYTASRLAVMTNERFYIGYTYQIPASGVSVYGVAYAPSSQTVGNMMSITTTTDAQAQYLVIWVYWDSHTEALDTLQLELGSTATAYEPYHGQTVNVPFPITLQNPEGIYYGGNVNLSTGVLTIDRIKKKVGNYAWSKNTGTHIFYSNIDRTIKPQTSIICSEYKSVSWEVEEDNMPDLSIKLGTAESNQQQICIRDDRYSNASTFKSDMSDVEFVYYLDEPTAMHLHPQQISTILGLNNIWADSGDILSLTYRADMKTYVDEQVAEANLKTRQMMTTVTTEMVAPSNLVIGDIVIVNDDLYKVINSNIASGEAMVVGTNVEQITLTEYIQSLI